MDETRTTARLPHLDVEIVHRRLPEAQGEQLAISLRAYPSFDALARALDGRALFWPWLAANPFVVWQRLLQAAWQPWLDQPGPQRLVRDDSHPGRRIFDFAFEEQPWALVLPGRRR